MTLPDLPPINYEKLEELQKDPFEEQFIPKPTLKTTWNYVLKDIYLAFLIVYIIQICLDLIASFSSFYVVITYPILLLRIGIAYHLIKIRKNASLAIIDQEMEEENLKRFKKLFRLYVIQSLVAVGLIIAIFIVGTTVSPVSASNARLFGTLFTYVLLVVVFLAIILAVVYRYLETIKKTIQMKKNIAKSGASFLVFWFAASAVMDLFSLIRQEDTASLVKFAQLVDLTYTPPAFVIQAVINVLVIISSALIAIMIMDSKKFDS